MSCRKREEEEEEEEEDGRERGGGERQSKGSGAETCTCIAHAQHMCCFHSPPQSELSSESTKPQSEGEREEGRRLDTVDKDKVLAAATVPHAHH